MINKFKKIFWNMFMPRVSTTDLAVYTRQLATLFNSGLPLIRVLDVMWEQTNNIRLKTATTEIRESLVEYGLTLSNALKHHKDIFSGLYVTTVKCGEHSGFLPMILQRLAKNLEDEVKIQNRYKAALTYPLIAFTLSLTTFIVALKYILPNFIPFFSAFNVKLSFPSRVSMALGGLLGYWWSLILIFLLAFILIIALKHYFNTGPGRKFKDELLMNIPIVNTIISKIIIARFCRIFGLLYGSGYPLLPTFGMLKRVVNNTIFEKEIEKIIKDLIDGATIAEALGKRFIFPRIVTNMISIGEETGSLTKTIFNVVYYYELEVEHFLENINALLEPLIIVFLGILIAFILLAIILPFYDIIGGLTI